MNIESLTGWQKNCSGIINAEIDNQSVKPCMKITAQINPLADAEAHALRMEFLKNPPFDLIEV